MHDRRSLVLSGLAALSASRLPQGGDRVAAALHENHIAWVERVLTRIESIQPGMTRKALLTVCTEEGGVLTRIESIQPGMTRKALLTVCTEEGGLSTALQRTYVSQDCPLFKVDVQLSAVGRPAHDADGRATSVEDARDLIVSISRPYLASSILD